MNKKYDTVIFDLDGTLLDTLDDLTDSANHALSVMGLETRTREEIRQRVGNGAAKLIGRIMPASAKSADLERALSLFREYYNEHCNDRTAPYPGIIPMLDRLQKKGVRLAVVSNKPDSAVKTLCGLHFGTWIGVAIGEREGVRRKPAPDPVYAALAELDLITPRSPGFGLSSGSSTSYDPKPLPSPRTALYVGDSDVDIATAAAAGMDCVSVTWGFRDEAFLRAHGAAVLAHTPMEVVEYVSSPN